LGIIYVIILITVDANLNDDFFFPERNKWLQTYLFDKTSLVMLNVSYLGCYAA